MGEAAQGRGNVGLARPPRSGAPRLPFRRAEDSPRPSLTAGRPSGRVPNRVVDLEAYCQSNLERISGALPSQRAVAPLAWNGLELSEARAPCLSTRRGRDCPLAPLSVAAYKKRPRSWARTWFSWMKVAFCSSPTSNAPGRPKDRLLTVPCGTNKAASTPLTRWSSRPNISTWRFMRSSIVGLCEEKRWSGSSSRCSAICAAP